MVGRLIIEDEFTINVRVETTAAVPARPSSKCRVFTKKGANGYDPPEEVVTFKYRQELSPIPKSLVSENHEECFYPPPDFRPEFIKGGSESGCRKVLRENNPAEFQLHVAVTDTSYDSERNSPTCEQKAPKKLSSHVSMMVSCDDRQSPLFRPVSGFSDDCGSYEVLPLRPAEGFDYASGSPQLNFYTEHTSAVPYSQIMLPSVQVFNEDDTLVAKTSFTYADDEYGGSKRKKNISEKRRTEIERSLNPKTRPQGPGSLFVKPIEKHCATGSGELYVAPVDSAVILACRKALEVPFSRGNSRRKVEQLNRAKDGSEKLEEKSSRGHGRSSVKARGSDAGYGTWSDPNRSSNRDKYVLRKSFDKSKSSSKSNCHLSQNIQNSSRDNDKRRGLISSEACRHSLSPQRTSGRSQQELKYRTPKDFKRLLSSSVKSKDHLNSRVSYDTKNEYDYLKGASGLSQRLPNKSTVPVENVSSEEDRSAARALLTQVLSSKMSCRCCPRADGLARRQKERPCSYHEMPSYHLNGFEEGMRMNAKALFNGQYGEESSGYGGCRSASSRSSPTGATQAPPSAAAKNNKPNNGMLITNDNDVTSERHNENYQAGIAAAGSRASKYMVVGHPTSVSPQEESGCENVAFEPNEDGLHFDQFGNLCSSPPFDLGYGSERSDDDDDDDEDDDEEEEESTDYQEGDLSSDMLDGGEDGQTAIEDWKTFPHGGIAPGAICFNVAFLSKIYPFINESTLFEVTIVKNARGLGLSVTGGVECEGGLLPGLIRVRHIYPQTSAWLCQRLAVNDLLLEANGRHLTMLTSHQALEVLRTAGSEVHLSVCRAPEDVLHSLAQEASPTKEGDVVATSLTAPQPINAARGYLLTPSASLTMCGEFEMKLRKVGGSLGFKLRKNDNSILGHTILSLVKEPAISDGRMRPGDKLLSVNGTDLKGLSHEEAVRFLRTCSDDVCIRLYRDAMQTPLSPASPAEPNFGRKPLRQEARALLSNIAYRRRESPPVGLSVTDNKSGNRPRRRLNKQQGLAGPSPNESKEDRWASLIRRAECSGHNAYSDMLTASASSTSEDTLAPSPSPSFDESRPTRPNFLDLSGASPRAIWGAVSPSSEVSPLRSSSNDSKEDLTFASLESAPPALDAAINKNTDFVHCESTPPASLDVSALSREDQIDSVSRLDERGRKCKKKKALTKWKGVVLATDGDARGEDESDAEGENGVDETLRVNNENNLAVLSEHINDRVRTVSINRGWNSRLGFSLRPSADGASVVSAVFAAHREGILKQGDVVLQVNGNDVRHWETQAVIDLLRKTSGEISITVEQSEEQLT